MVKGIARRASDLSPEPVLNEVYGTVHNKGYRA